MAKQADNPAERGEKSFRAEIEQAMERRFERFEKIMDDRFLAIEKLISAKFELVSSRLDEIEKRSVTPEQITKIRTELRAVKERVSSIPT